MKARWCPPAAHLFFPRRSWVNPRPDERNSIGRSDILRGVDRVREFVPRHRSGPAWSPVLMSLRFDYDGNGRVDLRHSVHAGAPFGEGTANFEVMRAAKAPRISRSCANGISGWCTARPWFSLPNGLRDPEAAADGAAFVRLPHRRSAPALRPAHILISERLPAAGCTARPWFSLPNGLRDPEAAGQLLGHDAGADHGRDQDCRTQPLSDGCARWSGFESSRRRNGRSSKSISVRKERCKRARRAETGAVKILRYVVAHDCGRLINPLLVDGQICGGVVHGIGNAQPPGLVVSEDVFRDMCRRAENLQSIANLAAPVARVRSPPPGEEGGLILIAPRKFRSLSMSATVQPLPQSASRRPVPGEATIVSHAAPGLRNWTPSPLWAAEPSPIASAILVAIESDARRRGSLSRWAYRAVVADWVCPSSFPMIGRPKPPPAPMLAYVWRRSWMRTPSSLARLATACQGRLRSVRGFSGSSP